MSSSFLILRLKSGENDLTRVRYIDFLYIFVTNLYHLTRMRVCVCVIYIYDYINFNININAGLSKNHIFIYENYNCKRERETKLLIFLIYYFTQSRRYIYELRELSATLKINVQAINI